MINFFTSFNKNYAPQAITLCNSIRENCSGNFKITGLLIDKVSPSELEFFKLYFDNIILPKELHPLYKTILESHNVVEACTLFKPFAANVLLSKKNDVIYLDPDTFVVGDLSAYFVSISSKGSVFLTPHMIKIPEGVFFNSTESSSLKHGIYNLGYLGLKNSELSVKFCDWWGRRILLDCRISSKNGGFTDQKIIDFSPALFPEIYIDRNPGLNIASWNIHERNIRLDKDRIKSNDENALFFHFTKINHVGISEYIRNSLDSKFSFEIVLFYNSQLKKNMAICQSIGLNTKWAYEKSISDANGQIHNSGKILHEKYRDFLFVAKK